MLKKKGSYYKEGLITDIWENLLLKYTLKLADLWKLDPLPSVLGRTKLNRNLRLLWLIFCRWSYFLVTLPMHTYSNISVTQNISHFWMCKVQNILGARNDKRSMKAYSQICSFKKNKVKKKWITFNCTECSLYM